MCSRYPVKNSFSGQWQENDGVVPMISMTSDAIGQVVMFNGSSQRGKWNIMRQLDRLGHLAVVGVTLHTRAKDVNFVHTEVLKSKSIDDGAGAIAAKLLSTTLVVC